MTNHTVKQCYKLGSNALIADQQLEIVVTSQALRESNVVCNDRQNCKVKNQGLCSLWPGR